MLHVLEVLQEDKELVTEVPEEVLTAFGQSCYEAELVDDQGYFYDSRRLVRFFVNRARKT